LTPNGDQDVFLLKLNSSGNFLWCISFGGGSASSSYNDTGYDLALDNQGNILVTGIYKGTCDFDAGIGTYTISSNSGNPDIFVAKYNSLGSFIWAKSIGGVSNDMATSIDIDLSNNIYVSGQFYGNTDFDPGAGTFFLAPSLPNSNGTFSISSQIFHLKLDSNGNFIWANQSGDYSDDLSFSSIDNQGNMFSSGRYAGTVDFDPGTGISNLTSPASYYGIFVRKLDSNGNFMWVHGFNGSINSEGTSISTDQNGDVLITGFFQGTIDFDPGASVFNLTSNGGTDGFILKLSNSGGFIWAKQVASNSLSADESFTSVTTDSQNNIYAIGFGSSNINNIDLDPGTGTYYLSNNYGSYLLKLNQSGAFDWAICPESSVTSNYVTLCQTTTGAGGSGWDGGFCIDVSSDAIYITGAFDHTVDFDPNSGLFNLTSLGNNNSKDLFVHKLLLCQATTNSINITTCNSYTSPSGAIHTISGIFNDTIPNAAGCDSIITINLTINQNTSSSISPSSCGAYTAPDGQIYNIGGNYSAVISNAAGCDSTISINLTILSNPTVSAGVDQTVCDGTAVTLNGSGAIVYTWDQSVVNGISFIPPVGINQYTLIGTGSNGCTDTSQVTVTVNPLPVVSFTIDTTIGCSPLTFNLTNTTPNSLNCTWDISNGDDLIGCGTVNGLLNQVGCHDITLTTTDNNGCSNSYTATNVICVEALPNASFSASASSFSQPDEQIDFTNNSTGASSYSWDFGDLSPLSTVVDPTHVYEDGVQDSFIVELVAYSSFGCSDTSYLTIYNTIISDTIDTDVFIPTGFSPNNDNENDSWTITGLDKYPNTIINVFNRWGQLLFEGDQGNSTWNGLYQGEVLPTADYYYVVDLGNGTKFNGVVTLKQ
jgi:gliding motility-associated-like protein